MPISYSNYISMSRMVELQLGNDKKSGQCMSTSQCNHVSMSETGGFQLIFCIYSYILLNPHQACIISSCILHMSIVKLH